MLISKNKKKNKNVKTNKLGEKKGRLYVERQNLDAIALKKRKVCYFINFRLFINKYKTRK